ncbi:MAG: hypothetical protein ABI748_12375, partial [Dokdonella sp.]
MEILSGGIALPGSLQLSGRFAEKRPHRALVLRQFMHASRQHLADHARNTNVVFRRVNPRPSSGLLIQSNGDVFHKNDTYGERHDLSNTVYVSLFQLMNQRARAMRNSNAAS